jgi:hypothetical protein
VGASLRVPEEGTDLFGDFGAERVLNLAGVFVEQVLVEAEGFVEQPLGKAMPADDVPGASLTATAVTNPHQA